jgi:hypothetical protein
MTPQFILWGLPGFIAYYLLQSVRPTRTKSGWDFVVEVGLLSLVCYVISHVLLFSAQLFLPTLCHSAETFWPSGYPADLAIGLFPVAELVGITLAKTNPYWASALSAYHRWVTGRDRNFQFSDVFFATCDELLGQMVLVTVTSGKVYVGILIAATEDPNESRRFLRLIPILSGYRNKDTLKVSYTTLYEPTPDTRRAFLLPAEQVSTLGLFDWDRFDHFVRTGDISIEIRTLPAPDASGDAEGSSRSG